MIGRTRTSSASRTPEPPTTPPASSQITDPDGVPQVPYDWSAPPPISVFSQKPVASILLPLPSFIADVLVRANSNLIRPSYYFHQAQSGWSTLGGMPGFGAFSVGHRCSRRAETWRALLKCGSTTGYVLSLDLCLNCFISIFSIV